MPKAIQFIMNNPTADTVSQEHNDRIYVTKTKDEQRSRKTQHKLKNSHKRIGSKQPWSFLSHLNTQICQIQRSFTLKLKMAGAEE